MTIPREPKYNIEGRYLFEYMNFSKTERQRLLQTLIRYFELHLGDFRKPKSLQIFNQVFN